MTSDDMSYLVPLFKLASHFLGHGGSSFRLRDVEPGSRLAGDDDRMEGYPVSHVVAQGIAAALDHAHALRLLVVDAGTVTNASPWTLLRGTLEPASCALWMLIGGSRSVRQERALKFWRHDMSERAKWEDDTGIDIPRGGRRGGERAQQMLFIARKLELRENIVNSGFNYADSVAAAGEAVGWPRTLARGIWRECSGFAHGSHWPALGRSKPTYAERIPNGVSVGFTLATDHHRKAAELAGAILKRAIAEYTEAAQRGAR